MYILYTPRRALRGCLLVLLRSLLCLDPLFLLFARLASGSLSLGSWFCILILNKGVYSRSALSSSGLWYLWMSH